jgi:hypothetical protein
VLGVTDEAAVDEAAARLSGVRVPRAVQLGVRLGALAGALPGVWLAARGGWLSRVRGESAAQIVADVAFGLCLVAGAGALVGAAIGALVGAGRRRGAPERRRGPGTLIPGPRGDVSGARRRPAARGRYSCAGSGSIVCGSTGIWTSSRYGDVIMKTRILGKASMKLV